MNKKKLLTVISVFCLLFFLTGCSKDYTEITLDTTFDEIWKNNGIFTAVLTYPLSQAINYLAVKIDVFWAIVIVTVTINAILLALTFKSNVAMQRMQVVQPELQKIQKKYEGRNDQTSQQRMSQEMNNLYKKYDINPFGALAVTFLQFPILIAMYTAVRRSTAVANGTFLNVSLNNTPMDAFKNLIWPLIAIYIFMILTQILSVSLPQILNTQRLKREAEIHHKHYEKPQQQNVFMTYFMVIFIGYIMLSWPCALSLYYVIVSVINIIKTIALNKLTAKQIGTND